MLRPAIERGEIRVVGDQYVDRWLPEVAQRTMEQILTATSNGVAQRESRHQAGTFAASQSRSRAR